MKRRGEGEQKSKTKDQKSEIGNWDFEFVCDLDIRIWDLERGDSEGPLGVVG